MPGRLWQKRRQRFGTDNGSSAGEKKGLDSEEEDENEISLILKIHAAG